MRTSSSGERRRQSQPAFLRMKRIGDVESGQRLVLLDQMGGNVLVESAIALQPAVDAKADRILAARGIDVNVGGSQCQRPRDQIDGRRGFRPAG